MLQKIFTFVFCCAICAANVVHASSIVPLNLRQLAKSAGHIIKGEITDLHNVEENNRILTYVTVTVTDWIKGTPTQDRIYIFSQVAKIGADLNKQFLNVPQYNVGKTYVLFLPSTRADPVMPVGGAQGVFRIENDQVVGLEKRKKTLRYKLTSPDAKRAELLQKNLADAADTSFATFKQTLDTVLLDT